MPNYHPAVSVNWREILRLLRWQCERSAERIAEFQKKEITRLIKIEKKNLAFSIKIYTSLRKFLGYGTLTKLEQTCYDLLRS